MVNEALCKLIAHNLGCVVRYVYLRGIAPVFLKHAKDDPAFPADEDLPKAN
jgi:hypothetical protein